MVTIHVFYKTFIALYFFVNFFNLKYFVPFLLDCLFRHIFVVFQTEIPLFSANQSVCLSVPLWIPYFHRVNNFGQTCKKQTPRTPRGLSFKMFSAKLINFPHYIKIICLIWKMSAKFAPWNMKIMSNLNIVFKYVNTM